MDRRFRKSQVLAAEPNKCSQTPDRWFADEGTRGTADEVRFEQGSLRFGDLDICDRRTTTQMQQKQNAQLLLPRIVVDYHMLNFPITYLTAFPN